MIDIEKMSILIVDDMKIMCRTIRNMLKVIKFGEKYTYASNGVEAWNLLQVKAFDLAIIDWNMPMMNGVELISKIRKDKALRDMPVIMVTAESNRGIVAEVCESDIDNYILKPLTMDALSSRIKAVILKANNPSESLVHIRNAREFEENGDMESAIKEALEAGQKDPKSSRPIRILGSLFYKKKDFNNAEKFFIRCVKMNKLDVFAWHHLGEIYLQKNNIEKSSLCFEKAMEISPRHVDRGMYFGKILVKKNLPEKAIKIFNNVLEFADNVRELQEKIALIAIEHNLYNYAITHLRTLYSHNPTRTDIIFHLGYAHEMLKDYTSALNFYTQVAKKDKKNIKLLTHIANCYIELDMSLRADQIIKDVLAIDPDNEKAHALLKKCV